MEVNHSGFWDIAYRDNAPALLGVLRRYVKDVSVAQDLLHEVFITAIDKYDGYTGKGSFEGWLYRIAVNTALMHLRNERNRQVAADAVLSVMDDDDTDDKQADNIRTAIEAAEFTGEELISAIDRLPEHHKLVFNMYVMEDFSHKQIAAELHISPGTSKSHLARARKKIQQFLYEDAMNRTKKRDRRRASAFLLFFPAKTNYIDHLYRDGLSDFTIPPTGGTEFLSAALEQHAASAASIAAPSVASVATQAVTFWGGKLSYMVACCGTAAITGTVCWMAMGDNSPLNNKSDKMDKMDKMELMIDHDTLMYSPDAPMSDEMDAHIFDVMMHPSLLPVNAIFDVVQDQDHPADSVSSNEQTNTTPSSDEKKTDPVVVKKQIIQRQTVVVRDTIFIIE